MKLRGSESVRVSDVKQMEGGMSNVMYSFHLEYVEETKRHSKNLILRMSNNEEVLNREFLVLQKLDATSVPVPKVYDRGRDILGLFFIIMERVKGQNMVERRAAGMPETELRELWQQSAMILADIHMIDWEKAGFGFLNPPAGKFGFVDGCLSTVREGLKYTEFSDLMLVVDWLDKHKPPSNRHVLLHGDYHINNALVDNGKLMAIIDWEHASIGDAVYDVAEVPLVLKLVNTPGEQLDNMIDTFLKIYQGVTGGELRNLDYYQILKAIQFLLIYLLAPNVDKEPREEAIQVCARQIEEMTALRLPSLLTGR